ncbi:MAG: hypothetical protein SPG13_06925 [Peptostreptococcus porci]|uniref:hypothetical protein n=2 Tax=Peptostreptococcus porci TaxID=2652282 RepID=UPI002A91EC7A|nr:hypothetical protein [Peptostreptococcus porci]MDY5480179.1 hypothetical protein [Peptostreptococcus porci]
MAGKIYDIMNRLNKAKPKLKLAEDVEFTVNNSMAGAIALKAISEDDSIDDLKKFEQLIAIGIGTEGLEYVKQQDYSIMEWGTISNAIMAAISEEELEDIEKRLGEDSKNE